MAVSFGWLAIGIKSQRHFLPPERSASPGLTRPFHAFVKAVRYVLIMNPSPIILAQTDPDIVRCFPVMLQLRTHLVETEFVSRVRRMQQQGYQLALLADTTGTVRSVAGFRIMELLYSGKTLYVDDLVTDSGTRSQGYGDRLIDWLVEFARSNGCNEFSLDSGTQRVDAHRFYLRKRMKISSFHFSLPLNK